MTPRLIRARHLGAHWGIYLFVLPSLALIGLFQYYPALSGGFHSLYRWNGADAAEFVGLQNYLQLLGDADFWHSFRIALILGFWNILKIAPALALAVCIHRVSDERLRHVYRVLLVAPMVVPVIVIVLVWRGLFFESTSGYLNQFLLRTHLFDLLAWADATFHWGGLFTREHLPEWLGNGRLLLAACILWGFPWIGSFAVLTYLAKLEGIPRSLYESAALDGVNWWGKFTRLELPLLKGTVNLMLVFVVIETIKDAATILALAGFYGGPGGAVTVPALFMLRKAFIEQQMGAACAVGIVLTVVVLAFQRLMTVVVRWEELSSRRKMRTRIGLACASVGMLLLLHSPFLAACTLLAAIPWPRWWRVIRGLFSGWAISLPALPLPQASRRMPALPLRAAKHAYIWLVLLLAYLPLYLMLVVSLKDNAQFYAAPAHLTAPLHWENWPAAWNAIIPSLANSVFITILSTLLTLTLALAAAYFFARVRVPGSNLLWGAIVLLMMMPTVANLIPLFRLLVDLNLTNTLTALIAVGAAGGQVVAIFMLRHFVADLPDELFEAAEMDGASHFRQLVTIVLPLSAPILGVVGVMHALSQWNDFLLPLIIIRDHAKLPVMVELLRLAGEYIKFWGPLMAGYALASLPIIALFIACMRLFTRGLMEGAVKG